MRSLKENYYKKSIKVGNLEVVYDLYELFDSFGPIDDFMSTFKEYLTSSQNSRIRKLRESKKTLGVSDIFHVIDFHNHETWYYDTDSDIEYFNQIVSKYMIDGGYFSYYMDMILRCKDIPNLRAEIMKYVFLNFDYIVVVYHFDLIYDFALLYGKTSLKNSRIEEDVLRRAILRKVAKCKIDEDFKTLEKTVSENMANDLIDPTTRNGFFDKDEWGENESSCYVEAGAIDSAGKLYDLDLPINLKTIEAVINHKNFAKIDRRLLKEDLIGLFADFASQKLDCRRKCLEEVCNHFFNVIMRWSAEERGFLGLLDNGKPVGTLPEIVDEIENEKALFLVDELSFENRYQAKMTKLLLHEQDKIILNSSLVRTVVKELLEKHDSDCIKKCFEFKSAIYEEKIFRLLERFEIIKNDDGLKVLISDMTEFNKKVESQKIYCSDFVGPTAWSEYLRVINCTGHDRKDQSIRAIVEFAIRNEKIDPTAIQLYCGKGHGYASRIMLWLAGNGIIEDGNYHGSRRVLVSSLDEFDKKIEENEILRKAIEIAFLAHENQVDKSGVPYIWHPLAVASRLGDAELKVIAILHDVVEDSEKNFEYLLKQGIPEETVEIVKLLTKPKNVEYEEYLKKIKQNPKALAVKLADLAHNTDPSRAGGLDESRRKKYAMAKRILTE